MPAHENNNPILPRRDRTLDQAKSRNPSVPRAPRAKARANSVGAFAREMKKESANSSLNSSASCNVSRTSEFRRPAAESPFSHARVNHLHRERTSVDNQVFEMGPKGRSSSVDPYGCEGRNDHGRCHGLGKESAVNQGMPWATPKENDDLGQPKARQHTLRREHMDADQTLEWVPERAPRDNDSDVRSHARVNIYDREVGNAAQALEMAPMVQISGFNAKAVGEQFHGRRNILHRERGEESNDAPRASGFTDEGVPVYQRKSLLPPYVPRVSAAH